MDSTRTARPPELRAIFEHSRDAIGVSTAGVHVLVNPAYARMFGFERAEELVGTAVLDLIAPEHHARVEDYIRDRARGQSPPASYELTAVRRDGSRFDMDVQASSYTLDGEAHSLVILRDVTARKRIEEELRVARASAEGYLRVVEVILVALDERGRVTMLNRKGYSVLGYAEGELTGQSWFDVCLPPDESAAVLSAYQGIIAGDLEQAAYYENHVVRRDGTRRLIAWHNTFLRDDDRRIIGSLSSGQDITEWKAGQVALQMAHAALEHSAEAVYWARRDSSVFYVNEASVQALGYSREELLKLRVVDFSSAYPVDGWESVWSARWEAIRRSGSLTFSGRHRRKDGREIEVELNVSHLRFDGEEFLCAFARDITERRREEDERRALETQLDQLRRMESIGRLAGGVAHDFNNMLSVILGHSDMILARLPPDAPLRSEITEIRRAADRSADLTRQLLGFARRQTVAPRVLDLNDTVEGMLRMLRRLIGENIDLQWRPGAGLWPVKIDAGQVDQILANLCVNARDAIGGVGSVTIETANVAVGSEDRATQADRPPGDYVLLTVRDSGPGMAPEILDHVFEPFFTTKDVGQGTGLGLSTVYGIVRQNGGAIDVESRPGVGTSFRIHLPRHVGEVKTAEAGSAVAIGAGRGETLLIVEDEPRLLRLTKEMLERLGYRVLAAATPAEAIRTAERIDGDLDLLVTDVIMPEMNGRDLAERLTAARPGLRTLFVSGYTADVIAREGAIEPEVHFLQKPFTMEALASRVREALESS